MTKQWFERKSLTARDSSARDSSGMGSPGEYSAADYSPPEYPSAGFDSSTFGAMPGEQGATTLGSNDIISDASFSAGDLRRLVERLAFGAVAVWAAVSVFRVVALNNRWFDRPLGFGDPSSLWNLFSSVWFSNGSMARENLWLHEIAGTYLLSPLFLLTLAIGILAIVRALGPAGRWRRPLSSLLSAHVGLTAFLSFDFDAVDSPLSMPYLVRAVCVPVLAYLLLPTIGRRRLRPPPN